MRVRIRALLPGALLLVLLLPLLVDVAPPAAGHAGEHGEGLEEQLVRAGEGVLVGRFDAPQPGPLVIVPFHPAPLPCALEGAGAWRVPLGGGAGVGFAANATHLHAALDLPRDARGFAAFAVDTNDAVRALLLMQEQAIALHRVAATTLATQREANVSTGVMGLPYALPQQFPHAGDHPSVQELEASGVRMAWDPAGGEGPGETCRGSVPGHVGLSFPRDALRSLGEGAVVHALVLWEPVVEERLPRPLETTHWRMLNLYLARPGEDAAQLRAALDPAPGAAHVLPLGLGLVGLAWVARRGAG